MSTRVDAVAGVAVFVAGTASATAVILGVLAPSGFEGIDIGGGTVGLVYAVLGAAVLRRRPRNPIGWILLSGVSFCVAEAALAYATTAYGQGWPGVATAELAHGLLETPTGHLVAGTSLLLFPDGAATRPRRWLVRAVVAGAALFWLGSLTGGAGTRFDGVRPIVLVGWSGAEWLFLGVVPVLVGFAGGLAAVVVDRSRATGVERQRYDWLVFGGCLTLVGFGLVAFGDAWVDGVGGALLGLSYPVTLAVAIARYRLFDIDRVVSRTLTYGLLTVSLGSVYVVLVLGAQAVLERGGDAPDVVVAGATLLVAALFQPLRGRIQERVDRRFARRRYDAVVLLAGFTARLRDTVRLEQINDELGAVVQGALAPTTVSVWLGPNGPEVSTS